VSAGDGGAGQQPPVLRVVRGDASAEELAALVAVLSARTTAGAAAVDDAGGPKPRAPGWADRGAVLRRPLRAGAGAWRASGLPR
jgi:hypothetical protein